MNELQLKLERRRKSMADAESGARLDVTVSSQRAAGALAPPRSSATPNEMLAKLERRRRLNEEGGSADMSPVVDTAVVIQAAESTVVKEPESIVPDAPLAEVGDLNNESVHIDVRETEVDSRYPPLRRPPIAVAKSQNNMHRRPPPVPEECPPQQGSSSKSALDSNSSPIESVGQVSLSSTAASLVLPWNTGIHSLRGRKTPEKPEKSSAGLSEAHAIMFRRRKSVKMKLSSDFDAAVALHNADMDTLRAILAEFELEMGPGERSFHF